jgi:hypothetical protein
MTNIKFVQYYSNFAELSKKKCKEPKFEVSNSINKNLAQQCGFRKVWKILLSQLSKL